MATISNAQLAITTDILHERASISVSCDVEFTDVEVNAMNLLGLHYRLECLLLNKDLWQFKPVAVFDEWLFPRALEARVQSHEHVVFNSDRPMVELRKHLISEDKLVAQLTLRNEETSDEVVSRTGLFSIDLTASSAAQRFIWTPVAESVRSETASRRSDGILNP